MVWRSSGMFLDPFLFRNILEHANRAMGNTVFIPQFHGRFKDPADPAVAVADAVLASPDRIIPLPHTLNGFIPCIFGQAIQQDPLDLQRVPTDTRRIPRRYTR